MNEIQESYNNLPYISSAFSETSPARLEALASFLSLTPSPSKTAKVLEIGCSYGGNLFPFAIANPQAKVLGIDLSEVQINKAKELAEQMRVDNIKFMAKDICDFTDADVSDYGKFDYIICHGVYSWVPDVVKDAILKTIKRFLSPNGVAYVSYNVYPGWKIKDTIRDFLMFGTKDIKGEAAKVAKAREILKTLGEYAKFYKTGDNGLSTILINHNALEYYAEGTLKTDDSYIMHEYLDVFNNPVYFKDFAENLDKNGLMYLSEVSLNDVFESNLGLEKFDKFIDSNFKSRVEKEQALDFLTGKIFRASLIVHKELLGENFQVDIGMEELCKLHISVGFTKEDDRYKSIRGSFMKPQYNWLYQVFTDVYPASINFADVAALLKDDESAVKSAYLGFMEILAANCAKLTTYERPKVVYEAGKSRIKERVRGYFEYFSATDEPVIKIADELNVPANFSQFDAFIALKFNGENSLENIVKQTVKFAKERNLEFAGKNGATIKTISKNEYQKAAEDYVKDLELKLSDGGFLENF
ncbi:MAG: methyltransferase domain-containing protein [Campylobacter sp.]|uniref:methyltransferase domain-containing protein n=1 Tax=Campylobacter sp. TaxID=205 RepID=UPI003F9F93DB